MAQEVSKHAGFEKTVINGTIGFQHLTAESFIQSLSQILEPVTVFHAHTKNIRASFIDPTSFQIALHRFSPQPDSRTQLSPNSVIESRTSIHRESEGQVLIVGPTAYSLYEAAQPDKPDYPERSQLVKDAWTDNLVEAHKRRPGLVHYVQLPDGAMLVDFIEFGRKNNVKHSMTVFEKTDGNPLDILHKRDDITGLETYEVPLASYSRLPIQSSPIFERLFPPPDASE